MEATTPGKRERRLAALAWFRGPLTALVVSKLDPDSPFVAFQTRQAARFYATALVIALALEIIMLPFLLLLLVAVGILLVMVSVALISQNPDLIGGDYLNTIMAGLLLSVLPAWVIAMIPAVFTLGGAHLVGVVAAILVLRGHDVRLPLFARLVEARESGER